MEDFFSSIAWWKSGDFFLYLHLILLLFGQFFHSKKRSHWITGKLSGEKKQWIQWMLHYSLVEWWWSVFFPVSCFFISFCLQFYLLPSPCNHFVQKLTDFRWKLYWSWLLVKIDFLKLTAILQYDDIFTRKHVFLLIVQSTILIQVKAKIFISSISQVIVDKCYINHLFIIFLLIII